MYGPCQFCGVMHPPSDACQPRSPSPFSLDPPAKRQRREPSPFAAQRPPPISLPPSLPGSFLLPSPGQISPVQAGLSLSSPRSFGGGFSPLAPDLSLPSPVSFGGPFSSFVDDEVVLESGVAPPYLSSPFSNSSSSSLASSSSPMPPLSLSSSSSSSSSSAPRPPSPPLSLLPSHSVAAPVVQSSASSIITVWRKKGDQPPSGANSRMYYAVTGNTKGTTQLAYADSCGCGNVKLGIAIHNTPITLWALCNVKFTQKGQPIDTSDLIQNPIHIIFVGCEESGKYSLNIVKVGAGEAHDKEAFFLAKVEIAGMSIIEVKSRVEGAITILTITYNNHANKQEVVEYITEIYQKGLGASLTLFRNPQPETPQSLTELIARRKFNSPRLQMEIEAFERFFNGNWHLQPWQPILYRLFQRVVAEVNNPRATGPSVLNVLAEIWKLLPKLNEIVECANHNAQLMYPWIRLRLRGSSSSSSSSASSNASPLSSSGSTVFSSSSSSSSSAQRTNENEAGGEGELL